MDRLLIPSALQATGNFRMHGGTHAAEISLFENSSSIGSVTYLFRRHLRAMDRYRAYFSFVSDA